MNYLKNGLMLNYIELETRNPKLETLLQYLISTSPPTGNAWQTNTLPALTSESVSTSLYAIQTDPFVQVATQLEHLPASQLYGSCI